MGISFSLSSFWELLVSRWPELVTELFRHINMTTLALLISLAIGVPLGILITRNQTAAKIVIGIANVMQSIPSIALLSLAVCFLGIGTVPAILMVFVYAFLPILKNTYTGIMSVDPKNLEVARGMGLTRTRCLFLVELPIAAPFIMAGIRIAAVASVGTMTIAAFAGAKGLGWFINLGLNSLNVEMILLGAVPVSLLALLFDFIFAKLEQAVTSEGLLPNEQIQNLPKRVIRRRQVIAVGVCVALVVVAIGGGLSNKKSEKHITVGSANFTEVYIVGNIYKELIEAKTDIEVDTTFNLASTSLEMTAMENGDIDMVVDYSGQVYLSVLGLPLNTDPDEVYDILVDKMKNDYNIAVSAPLGYNNTYAMSVRPEIAEQYQLETLTDLMAVAPELRLGCTADFTQREDALPRLESTFNTEFAEVNALDVAVRYTAIDSGKVARLNDYQDGWYQVTFGQSTGYIPAEYAQPVHYADYEGTSATNTVREELIAYAYTYLGTPYVYGGSSYSGTDCSGFTMAVFAKFGYSLSHGASDQYYTATSVSSEERQAGDLVFFDTFGGISHVGIYLGGGQFIHASSSGGVKVNSLYESYYAACYLGAGRILP